MTMYALAAAAAVADVDVAADLTTQAADLVSAVVIAVVAVVDFRLSASPFQLGQRLCSFYTHDSWLCAYHHS